MCVIETAMLVGMCMRFPCGVLGTVLMPVVLVMHMWMCMRQGLVSMFMFVAFREVGQTPNPINPPAISN
jgi:hypothetical protein